MLQLEGDYQLAQVVIDGPVKVNKVGVIQPDLRR
jgi:hypothetical protein